ncbi:MAG: cell division protein FtsA [Buchnera aphidicola (Pentalonia nigronervosa)]|jgi:cell division protein FtsA|uniref:Cell division protein FtsA n=1 Tax=Buchnera aphidicola (Pentalonia nigronervosa) TaxID=1309793 RepID=A0A7H1AZM5_9GAMM|nr:MAG: cell division protein FtsA [Buchnera aphidicola (Pentalonia nigronervosa)]
MIKSIEKKLIVGLEIGTTKVITLVGEILINDTIKVIGIGVCSSKGIEKGCINNLDEIVQCVQKSIKKAEITSNCQISSLCLSVSNQHVNCQNEIGMVPILKEEVTAYDLDNVIHTAKSVKLPHEHHILHVIPKDYSIDQQSGIKNPIGLSGIRMQVKVHLITCNKNITKNMIKAVEKCHVKVDQVIFSGLASSKAVLTEDECNLGVCMIDIGGGTVDFTTYIDGSIQDSQVIPYAGNAVTNDISYAFSTSFHNAEKIKIKYGAVTIPPLGTEKNVDFSDMDDHLKNIFKQDALIEVIAARYIELMFLIKDRILYIQKKLHLEGKKCQLARGIVITGGGAKITCLAECAEKIFHRPVRIAKPLNISGLTENIIETPYSTVIGLLHYRKDYYKNIKNEKGKDSFFKDWIRYIHNWFKKEF